MNKNFLLYNFFNLSNFSAVKLNNIVQAKITNCYNVVDQVISTNNITTWDDLYYQFMIAENELQLVWSPIMHLNSVKHDLKSRLVYENNILSILEYKNWITHHTGLYKLYQKLYDSNFYHCFNSIQKVALKKILTHYKLSGITLSCNKKKRYQYITSNLSKLYIQYTNNVLDSTYGWQKLITNKTLLSGIPDYMLKHAYIAAQSNQQKGWLFNLQHTNYSSILSYCDNSELRKEFYWAFSTRASDQGPNKGKWDNTIIIDEILSLRYELARILGFNNYLEKSLITKMARYPKQVFTFLINLSDHLSYHANQEFLKIQNFAKKHYFHKVLNPWDIAYYQEKQKQKLFSITNIELRNYFPIETVLFGMFTVAQHIYNIIIKQRNNVNTWHPDVKFFDVFNKKNQWIGGFYIDLYQRINKYEGAWVDVYSDRMYDKDNIKQYQRPIIFLVCNFDPPDNSKKSSLLTHNDVITLFHEFGHTLQHILTAIDIPIISGMNGVPADTIEMFSQFMEKFCWMPNVLKLISMHHQTKQPLSINIINNLLRLKTHQSSFDLLKQVIYGLFDFRIHREYIPKKNIKILKIFKEIMQTTCMNYHVNIMDTDRFPHSFTHIFSDDYAAGYYGYLWSDMLASHIWLSMQKSNDINTKTGKFLLKTIFNLTKSSDLKRNFDTIFNGVVTTQSITQYYGISVFKNKFFKLM